jgi:ABC-type multidrug transport system ATPase subunit
VHLPFLTVRETFQFAHENSTADPALFRGGEGSAEDQQVLAASHAAKVDNVIKLLGLQNCQNTLVGDEMVRGISGGEKKRVTIGEALVSNARCFLFDEPSTGLDSAVTYDIMASIRTWVRCTNGAAVVALLQPTPEVYSLFDDIMLLRDGSIIYHGARTAVVPYLRGLGFNPPEDTLNAKPKDDAAAAAVDAPAAAAAAPGAAPAAATETKMDMADWLTEMLTHPSLTLARDRKAAGAAPRRTETRATLVSSPSQVMVAAPLPEPEAEAPKATIIVDGGKTSAADLLDVGTVAANASLSASSTGLTTEDLLQAWRAHPLFEADLAAAQGKPNLRLATAYTRQQYGRPYPRSAWRHLVSLVHRQTVLTLRNKLFISFRVVSSIFMAFVLGTTFFRLDTTEGIQKYGLFLFAALHISFCNFSEVPLAVEQKYVTYKNIAAGMYPSLAYVLSVALLHIPIALAETVAFAIIQYWVTGLATDAGRFFFYILVLFCINLAMAALFRIFAYSSPDLETAQLSPGPIISIQMLFGGFLITLDKMGWLKFMHYISVFGWALRSMAQNEFFDESYSGPMGSMTALFGSPSSANATSAAAFDPSKICGIDPTILANASTAAVAVTAQPMGLTYLQFFRFQTERGWKWAGIGFLLGFFLICLALSAVALAYVRIERNVGTSRSKEKTEDEGEDEQSLAIEDDADGADGIAPGSRGNSMMHITASPAPSMRTMGSMNIMPSARVIPMSALTFTPMTLVFQNIRYTVTLPKDIGGGTKVLLQGIYGAARPGKILALMGASGAGKSTLLDAVSGRKNAGKLEGSISLNGFPKEHKAFSRLCCYVEQQDIHNAFATVRESLEFSAALRLPASVSTPDRRRFIEEMLDILELRDIEHRKVGEMGAADGLSPGQRKRLTIGVELVSNAPVVFLDEPTSGLDSRAAAVVIRVLRNIAKTGRTVVTTIHQPSAEIFCQFDDLLLLQRGGWQVYFGPVGKMGRGIVRYLESIPGTLKCPRTFNPASYMLDVLGGTSSSGEHKQGDESENDSEDEAVVEHEHDGALGAAFEHIVKDGQTTVDVTHPHEHVHHHHPHTHDEKNEGPNDKHPGKIDYQRIFFDSKLGKIALKDCARLSTPKPGDQPFTFSSVYARSWFHQIFMLIGRYWRASLRNVDYNYTRVMTLIYLNVLFGVIYYKVDGSDATGVQSLASVMFMTTVFVGMLNMNTNLGVAIKERPVFYREKASFMYSSTPYAIASLVIELPWLALIVLTCVPVVYFMCGFAPNAAAFFFYCFVTFIFTVAFVSIAQAAAAFFSTIMTAQAVVSILMPVLFLFGGLFLREPSIPRGWKWLHYADPVKYVHEAIVAPQFFCDPTKDTCIELCTESFTRMDRYQYVQESFGIVYNNRWRNVGILFGFAGFFQILHFLAVKFVSHNKR